jgi:hypothetical protein
MPHGPVALYWSDRLNGGCASGAAEHSNFSKVLSLVQSSYSYFPAIPRIKKPDLDLAFHNEIKLVSQVPLTGNNLTSIEFHLLDI